MSVYPKSFQWIYNFAQFSTQGVKKTLAKNDFSLNNLLLFKRWLEIDSEWNVSHENITLMDHIIMKRAPGMQSSIGIALSKWNRKKKKVVKKTFVFVLNCWNGPSRTFTTSIYIRMTWKKTREIFNEESRKRKAKKV